MSSSFVFKNSSLLELTIPLLVSSPSSSSSSYFDKKGHLTPCIVFVVGLYFFVLCASR
jgi:hypothetical protein